jgi:uncharacterized membrane protein
MVNPLLYFIVGFVVDALLILYYQCITRPNRLLGSILSGLITFINLFVLIRLVRYDSFANMIAYILGNVVATYFLIGEKMAEGKKND